MTAAYDVAMERSKPLAAVNFGILVFKDNLNCLYTVCKLVFGRCKNQINKMFDSAF